MTRFISVFVRNLYSTVPLQAVFPEFARLLAVATLLTGCIMSGQSHADKQNTLRISAIPDEAPTELIRKFEPLTDYLSTVVETPVSFVPVTDYAAAVEALVSKQIDMAWLGGFTYIQAAQRSDGKVEPIVQRVEDERFQSVFITQTDSDIQSIADLKGVSFSFGSPSSTSGHLMPRHFLSKQGIDVDNDLSIAFSGAHDATAFSVAGGRVAAGALNIKVWEKLIEKGTVDTDKLRVFYTTPEYHDYNWTIRAGLPSDVRTKLIEAFTKLDAENESDKIILDLQRATRFVPTQASYYDGIKRAAQAAELLGSN